MRDFVRFTAGAASRALLYELSATPKPGLVDRANNGAHSDMEFTTFLDSAVSLTPYFEDITTLGAELWRETPAAVFAKARELGLHAEARMLAATGGVNTHKGAIFSLGLACLAAGRLEGERRDVSGDSEENFKHSLEKLLALCAEFANCTLADLPGAASKDSRTHGEEQFLQRGALGARGEAADGFPAVRYALPVLRSLLAKGVCVNDAGALVLLHLLGNVDDSNVVHRAGFEFAHIIKEETRSLLAQNHPPHILLQEAEALDALFIRENISPGGCADMLAMTWLIHFLVI